MRGALIVFDLFACLGLSLHICTMPPCLMNLFERGWLVDNTIFRLRSWVEVILMSTQGLLANNPSYQRTLDLALTLSDAFT